MAEFKEGGSFVYDSDDHPNIVEIILLNLNNKSLRQEFFGELEVNYLDFWRMLLKRPKWSANRSSEEDEDMKNPI
ncbi:hypothetical protein BDR26DRAFT_937751 [Obelidium mucronatum]|nr:hypothetical protein BDR26DRAFT_937751 [Obelidium mucronatum]